MLDLVLNDVEVALVLGFFSHLLQHRSKFVCLNVVPLLELNEFCVLIQVSKLDVTLLKLFVVSSTVVLNHRFVPVLEGSLLVLPLLVFRRVLSVLLV